MLNNTEGNYIRVQNTLLKDFMFQSFYIGDEIINLYNTLYFKFDKDWYSFSLIDGSSLLEKINVVDLEELEVSIIKDKYKYPITKLKTLWFMNDFINTKLVSINQEYKNKWILSVVFNFEQNKYIRIREVNDIMSLSFVTGAYEYGGADITKAI